MTTDFPSDVPASTLPADAAGEPLPVEGQPAELVAPPEPSEVVANPDTSFRVKRYIVTALIIGMGLWFGYDGFVAWPKENEVVRRINVDLQAATTARDNTQAGRLSAELRNHRYHDDFQIRLQKILCFTLPPLGVAFLIWSLHLSRGQYRMKDDVVSVPGHPPVPIASVTEVDSRLWDKKGIATVRYALADGKQRAFKLDDFIYERKPTDRIYDRIQGQVNPPVAPVSETTEEDMVPEKDD